MCKFSYIEYSSHLTLCNSLTSVSHNQKKRIRCSKLSQQSEVIPQAIYLNIICEAFTQMTTLLLAHRAHKFCMQFPYNLSVTLLLFQRNSSSYGTLRWGIRNAGPEDSFVFFFSSGIPNGPLLRQYRQILQLSPASLLGEPCLGASWKTLHIS